MASITFALVIAVIGIASSAPIYTVPLTYLAYSPFPQNIYNHVQDTRSGEYAFGYAGGPVAREEAKTSDGVIRGAYSYVDAHGIVQYYRYVADDDGFRVIGTNIPGESTAKSQLRSVEAESPEVKNDAEKSSEKSNEQEESSSRRKRSVLYDHVTLEKVVAIPTVVAAASVPTSTSSQSRHQVHSSLKAEIHEPVQAVPVETVAAVPAAPVALPVALKSAEPIALAVAASAPTSTSSQFRHQVHSSLKAEIHEPIQAVPVETVAAVPAAAVALPVALKSAEPIALAVAASAPTSTSSQFRHQVHSSLKAEIHEPIQAVPVETVATVPAAGVALPVPFKSVESLPYLARHQVGVGLGVLPSPYATYYNYENALYIRP